MVGRKRSVNLLQWGSLLREGSNTGRKGCWGGAMSMGGAMSVGEQQREEEYI
jgi:hypothetical protein